MWKGPVSGPESFSYFQYLIMQKVILVLTDPFTFLSLHLSNMAFKYNYLI